MKDTYADPVTEAHSKLFDVKQIVTEFEAREIALKGDLFTLKAKLEKAEAALEFYGDGKNWSSMTDGSGRQFICVNNEDTEYRPNNEMMIKYGGVKARESLKEIRGRE